MKRFVSLFVVLCTCFSLCACGATTAASAATSTPAATAGPTDALVTATPEPTPEPIDLQPLVDSLNEAEVASRTEDAPSIGIFEVGQEPLTIYYKLAMHIFQYVIMMAQQGDAEALNAYNRLIESLPGLEDTLYNALVESVPDINIKIILMADEYTDTVAAVVEEGEIVYDLVNGVGTAPTGITSIIPTEELPPEVQEALIAALNGGEVPASTSTPTPTTTPTP